MASLFTFEKPDMKEFLSRKIDLLKYFSAAELAEMNEVEQKRYQNMVQNYDMMMLMGLPAIKPDFMRGQAYRAREAKLREQEYVSSSSDSDTDDDWTPYMDQKKAQKGTKRKNSFTVPVSQPKTKPKPEEKKPSKPRQKTTKPVKSKEPRKYELRERKVNFMNLEPPDEDHFLYCEECNKEYDMDCPVHGPLDYIQDKETSDSYDTDRALHSLPDCLVVKESSIVGAGLGVFTETEIPSRTMFGPYGGVQVKDQGKAHQSGYCWQVYENGKPSHFVDAQDKATSNWMRYVNCAVSDADQNLVAFQYKGGIYYRTFKPILPGQELLVWYGDEYARELGLVRDKNMLFRPSYVNGEVYYPCVFCKTAYSAAFYCVRHLMHTHGRDKLTADDIQVLDAWLRQNKYYRYSENNNKERTHFAKKEENEKKNINSKVKICSNNMTDHQSCNSKSHLNKSKVAEDNSPNDKNLHHKSFYKCDMCGYASNHKGHLNTHKRIHSGEKPFKCDVCGYASNHKGHLNTHKRIHSGEKPFKCDVCGFACNQKPHLIRHKRIHSGEKPFKCDVCGYASNNKGHLIRHKRIHSGEKPFKCDVCGFACNRKGDLIRHKRIHSGEKPFKCDVCGFACNQKSALIRHKRIHSGEKPFKCDVCGFACNRKGDLIRHKRIHSGEKPFKCDVCGYACNQKPHLIRHKRIHSGEKPFKCDVCGYACYQKPNLITHQKKHSGEKPFKCDVCGFACSYQNVLKYHKRKHTGEKM